MTLFRSIAPGAYRARFTLLAALASLWLLAPSQAGDEKPRWLLGHATHVPSEYTNQESGYFSIIEGKNGAIYIGAAKYNVNAYLIEFNPRSGLMKMVVDVHRVIGTFLKGFAAQAKIHTRNNVGQLSGKIYFGSKQGYPAKDEKRSDYPGGYVFAYDPKTGKTENFGMPRKHEGVISVMPDEARGLIYVSTCDDGRPIERSHFMVYDVKTKKYRDLGDCEISYAFIVLDHQGRAYHPLRGGKIARFDPDGNKLDKLDITVDGAPPPQALFKDSAILNWETSPDGKALYCVEMSTNQLFRFDLTAKGAAIPGQRLGALLNGVKATDCRALAVAPKSGKVWMALTEQGRPGGAMTHLVSYTPGDKAPRDHGPVGIANPDYVKLTDANGKPKPWHHTLRKEKDGTLTPWQPLGIAAAADGSVYVMTLAPFTVIRFSAEQLSPLSHTAVFGGGPRAGKELPVQRIRHALDQPITLDFSGASLQEALQHVRDKTGIEVNLDQVAIALMGININDNGDQPVALKCNGVKLGAALRKMLAAHQLAYVIYEDAILVTSNDLVTTRQMKQRINVDVNELPLNKALRELARAYAFNLVIDPKVAKDAARPVSLTLDGASLETSVRLLAEMGGLKAVRMDNVFFVTTEERADKLRKEERDLQPPPSEDPAMPGRKDAALIPGIGGIVAGTAIKPLPPTVNEGAPPPQAPEVAPGKKGDEGQAPAP